MRKKYSLSMKSIILSLLVAAAVCTEFGVDISTLHPDLKCLREGISFIIPRCYQSLGRVDPNCIKNLDNAHEVDLKTDLYIFPCFPCGNPAKQIEDTVAAVGDRNVGIYWIDVEVYQWSADKEKNRDFIREMVNALKAKGKKPGIYSVYYMWNLIVGMDWCEMQDIPLWYGHYDNVESCSDYKFVAAQI